MARKLPWMVGASLLTLALPTPFVVVGLASALTTGQIIKRGRKAKAAAEKASTRSVKSTKRSRKK